MAPDPRPIPTGGNTGGGSRVGNPNEKLGFEITPTDAAWGFVPEFYPEEFTQMKKRELNRYGGGVGGESVSIKTTKNREFHATGKLLEIEISTFQSILDHDGRVNLISPLTEVGGMECYVKKGEVGKYAGFDPMTRQRMFNYTIDLVSTGRDEYDTGRNAIVTAILSKAETGNN